MLRRISATPCPVPASSDLTSRRDSIFDATTTTNIDFTTEFTRANHLTSVKPRRRQTNVRREVVIHEDEPPQGVHQKVEVNANSGGSLLARPAKRLRGRVSFAADAKEDVPDDAKFARMPLGRIVEMEPRIPTESIDAKIVQPPRRRISPVGQSISKWQQNDTTTNLTLDQMGQDDRTLAKPPRRGTLYIPPDDTTMPSMYMGIFSPVKGMEKVDEKEEETQVNITGIAVEMAKRRGRRSSLAAEPARRVGPSRPVLGKVEEQDSSSKMNASQDVDRAGAATGKENLPPGFHRRDRAYDAKCGQDVTPLSRSAANYVKPVQRRPAVFGASILRNATAHPEQRKPAWNSGAIMKVPEVGTCAYKPVFSPQDSHKKSKVPSPPPRVPSRFVLPRVHQDEQPAQHFPPLSESIDNPAMYEDSWLTHQEIAITQLLNNLFSCASPQETVDQDLLRLDLLSLYQSPKFVLLHKRLNGAMLYGALRIPENSLLHAKRLQNDLGFRRSFIDLWTRTYERVVLKTALDVVIGRQCPATLKGIRTFIEVFLIRNEDGCPDADCTDHIAWSYRRTILRSLMLIQLLDHAKNMANSILTTSLFLTISHYKTSIDVLQALIQLLSLSMGQRALSHLEYTLEHKQHPLEEFSYPVTNLAIDVRSGVRLTRLVELLLYPSASPQLARSSADDTLMTLNMPTGEILSALDIDSPTKRTRYPLSQHLKFPSESRTVKLFNVQLALTALQQVQSMRSIVQGISAEDIVDGFRERTVALLWGLTGKWGLAGLIDWKDVRSEISRFQRKRDDDGEFLDQEEMQDLAGSFSGYKTLLKAWARAVAVSRGLRVTNLTTSFADGRVFEAVVDEYQRHMPSKSASPNGKKSLQDRLASLGCSAQFSSLFAAPVSIPKSGSAQKNTLFPKYHLFDRDFVLAALAFLASRLLSTSKRARASIVVQRAWRAYQLRILAGRRSMLAMLARQCEEVVRAREGIVMLRCKAVIWRAWRGYRARMVKRGKVHGQGLGMKDRREENYDHDEETKLDASVPGDLWLDL
jgi:abnormal spindle-like microcephaly-associated protein